MRNVKITAIISSLLWLCYVCEAKHFTIYIGEGNMMNDYKQNQQNKQSNQNSQNKQKQNAENKQNQPDNQNKKNDQKSY